MIVCVKPIVPFRDMLVRKMVEHAEAGSIFPLGMLAHLARSRDALSSDA